MTVHVSTGAVGTPEENARRDEYLHASDYGILPGLGTVGAELNALLATLGASNRGNTLMFNGHYTFEEAIVWPGGNRTILLMGTGGKGGTQAATVFEWPEELDAGEWAVRNDPTRNGVIRDIAFVGPGGGDITRGELPSLTKGVRVQNRLKLIGVDITGFAAGCGIREDHQEGQDVACYGNGHGMEWYVNSEGFGDQYFSAYDLRANAISSVHVTGTNMVANASFLGCYFGDSPFVFFREDSGTNATQPLVDNASFTNCAVGRLGNAFIYDERFDSTTGFINFMGGSFEGYDDDLKLDGYDRCWIKAKTIGVINFWGDIEGLYVADDDPADQVPVFMYKTMQDVLVFSGGNLLEEIAAGRAKFGVRFSGGQFDGASNAVVIGAIPGGQRMCVYGTASGMAGTITRGQLVQLDDDYFTVKKHTGQVDARAIGVLLDDSVSAGDACHIWFGGQGDGLEVKASGSISAWAPIKADPSTPGSVVTATSVADANCIGRAVAASSGGYVAAELFL